MGAAPPWRRWVLDLRDLKTQVIDVSLLDLLRRSQGVAVVNSDIFADETHGRVLLLFSSLFLLLDGSKRPRRRGVVRDVSGDNFEAMIDDEGGRTSE